MTAFVRELADTDWYTCRVTGVVDALKGMDAKTVKAANGTAGSSHAPPADQIVIGGKGMICAGAWVHSGTITTAPGAHIQHAGKAANDYLRLNSSSHPGRTRDMHAKAKPAASDSYRHSYSPRSAASVVTTRFPGTRLLLPLMPHDKSLILSVKLKFKLGSVGRALLPKVPVFRVVRVDTSGNVQALHTARSGSYLDDAFLPVPFDTSSVAAYQNGGAEQTSNTYSPDQYATVDLAKYAYFVDFIEETGPATSVFTPNTSNANGVGTIISRIEIGCGSITHMGPQ